MTTSSGALSEQQWRSLLGVSRALAATSDLGGLLKTIAEAATTLLDSERASVFLHDSRTGELWTRVALESSQIRVPASSGIVGAAFSTNQVVLVPSAQDSPLFSNTVDTKTGYVTRSLLAAPMIDLDGSPVGVIEVLNRRHGTFTDDDLPLIQLLADQAGVAVQRHGLQEAAVEAASMRHEMELARSLQQSMLPARAPGVRAWETAAWSVTASLTGGDTFDLWPLADGRLAIFVADAAGHGMAPALVISQVRVLLRAFADSVELLHPDQLLARINRRVSQDFPPSRFVTAFLGFAGDDGGLQWSSAGHGPVFLSRSAEEPFVELEPPQLPLGVDSGWAECVMPPVQLGAGGMLVIPSDGIFEAPNAQGELFGMPRLLELLASHRGLPPAELVKHVCATVQSWQGHSEPADDQTLVVVRRSQ